MSLNDRAEEIALSKAVDYAVAQEREACAKRLEELALIAVRRGNGISAGALREGAAAIRARGEREEAPDREEANALRR